MFCKSKIILCLYQAPYLLSACLFFSGLSLYAQQQQTESLAQLIQRFKSEEIQTTELLQKRGLLQTIQEKDGTLVKPLYFSPEGTLLYYETFSSLAENTQTHSAVREAQLASPLLGSDQVVGIWDAGAIYEAHQELNGRIFQFDQATEVNSHATEVSSVLLGKGIRAQARGMLPEGIGRVYDWNSDRIEVAEAAAQGLALSNHSYGIKSENVPDWYFGCYIAASRDWDALMYAAPNYLLVNAAGNNRGMGYNLEPLYGSPLEGYDELLGFSVSKNSLTVGSAQLNWSEEGVQATVSSYSAIGPTDDGRIKPDLVSDGNALETATSGGTQNYTLASGTSMATPAVSGGLLQLKEYGERLGLPELKAASLKGLALHTASDLNEIGPDYQMGWGAYNGLAGIHFLQQLEYSSLLQELELGEADSYKLSLQAREGETLRISISWTDPAGEAQRLKVNDSVAALVNDLDIRLMKDGEAYFPWKLKRDNPKAAATRGDNSVDPYERIDVTAASGEYQLLISHKGQLRDGAQPFTLLVSGAVFSDCALSVPDEVEILDSNREGLVVSWKSSGAQAYRIGYRQLGEEWQYVKSETNEFEFTNLEWGGFYEIEVYSECGKAFRSAPSAPIIFHYQDQEAYESLGETGTPKVFPNPARSFLMTSTSMQGKPYQIVDASGTVVSKGKGEGAINTSVLSSGLYFLKIQTEGTDWTALKFYKE